MTPSVVELPAHIAAKAMQRGEMDPREYLEAHIARIAATEPTIAAWSHLESEHARDAAAALAALPISERDELPLFGLPVGVKDVIDVAGQPTGAGFKPYEGKLAGKDAEVVARLRAAGAVVLGKTVTAQFAWGQDVPPTRNPRNIEHTPGASSTGTPAAVAAGQVPLAVGTQTTSSLLRPSAYCGVVGLKPSFGLVSCAGVLPTSWTSDHVGFSGRCVADVALALTHTAGYDAADPRSARVAPESWDVLPPLSRRPRIGIVRDYLERASDQVRSGIEAALGKLAEAGAELIERRLPTSYEMILAVHWATQVPEAAAIHAEQYAQLSEYYLPTVRQNFEIASIVPATALVQARRLRRRLKPQLLEMMAGLDAMIGPTASDMPPRIDSTARKARLGDPGFQVLATAFGFPALSLPAGFGPGNLPYAVQLFTAPFEETRLFSTAAWCERVLPPLGLALT